MGVCSSQLGAGKGGGDVVGIDSGLEARSLPFWIYNECCSIPNRFGIEQIKHGSLHSISPTDLRITCLNMQNLLLKMYTEN